MRWLPLWSPVRLRLERLRRLRWLRVLLALGTLRRLLSGTLRPSTIQSPSQFIIETGRGSTLAVPTKRGAPVTIRLQCLARVNSRGVHRFAQRRHPACLERLRRRKPPICLSAWRTTDGTPSSRMIRSCDAQAPANLPNPTKRDAERAHKQLARLSLALRCIGRKPKPRRPQRGCLIN